MPLSETKRNFPIFYTPFPAPKWWAARSCQRARWVKMYSWGSGLLSLTSTFASLLQRTTLVLLFASRKRLHTQRNFQVSVGERYRPAADHFWAILSCTHGWHVLYGALLCCQHWLSEASYFLEDHQLPWCIDQGNAKTSQRMQTLPFKKYGNVKWINNKRMGCPLNRICLYLKKIFFWHNKHVEQNGQKYQENGYLKINIILQWMFKIWNQNTISIKIQLLSENTFENFLTIWKRWFELSRNVCKVKTSSADQL